MVHSCGESEVDVPIGSRSIPHRFYVLRTKSFDFVPGTNFFAEHPQILSLTLQAPYVLPVDHGVGSESVPLEQSDHTSRYLRVCKKEPSAMMVASKTEDYQLLWGVLDQGKKEWRYSREDLNVELFITDKQQVLDLYCSKGQNCCYDFHWPSFEMAYRNSTFSELGNVLTNVAMERSRMVLCSPDWGAHALNEYWRTHLEKLTLTSTQLPGDAIYVPLARKTPIGKPGDGSVLSVLDGSHAPVLWEDLDPALVQEMQCQSSGYTLDVLKDRLWPRSAVETTHGGDEYLLADAVALNTPCHVPNPSVVSECGLSELPRSIHSDDEPDHDGFFVQTCVEGVENAVYATPQKPLFSMRREEPLDVGFGPGSRLREYMCSKRRAVVKRLCYATPTPSSGPLKQGSMGDVSQLKEDLEHKITTWQQEEDLKRMRSVWDADVRTPGEDELSEECLLEPLGAYLCCN